jgi:hypothetical protein
MKYLTITILTIISILARAQRTDHTWYSFGVQQMNKSMTAISDIYGDDHYSLINYPTCKGEFFTDNTYRRFDLSGVFFFILGMKNANTPNDGRNFQTTTNKSMEKVQDYLSWEWMSTKMKNPDKSFNHGFGWQIGMRRFGFAGKGLLKSGLTINPGYPDAGPYSYRGTLSGGMNYQLIKSFGSFATMRLGLVANALVGIGKYGAMLYPEASVNLHIWRIALIGTGAYETTYLYAPTQSPFESEAASNSGIVRGLRLEIGFGIDLQK